MKSLYRLLHLLLVSVKIDKIPLPIRYQLLIFMVVGLAIESQSQTNTAYPNGYNFTMSDIFNATNDDVSPEYAEQLRVAEFVLDGSNKTKCLTPKGDIEDNFDDSDIAVAGNINQTWANWMNWIKNANGDGCTDCDSTRFNHLQSATYLGNNPGAMSSIGTFYGWTGSVTGPSFYTPINWKEGTFHESYTHGTGSNDNLHHQASEPINWEVDHGNGFIFKVNGATVGGAGNSGYTKLQAMSTPQADINPARVSDDGYMYIPDPNDQGFTTRVLPSELVSDDGYTEVATGIDDFFSNSTYRVTNAPLTGEYAGHAPDAPVLVLSNDTLSIDTTNANYDKEIEIVVGSGEMLSVDYEWYIYYTSDTADGSQIRGPYNLIEVFK